MAREMPQEESLDSIATLLHDIRMQKTLTEPKMSTIHVFQDIIRNLTQNNSSNILPVLLTAEEREEIQKDRQKAIECEEQLARRKQEKYFDLVDQVQNVLKLIEKKKNKKVTVTENGICDIADVELSPSLGSQVSPSDCNNNPSPSQSETFFEHTDPFAASCCSDTKLSARFPHQENSKQGGMGKQKHNPSRHSLPANFEQYQKSSHSQLRPLSVFSDQPSVYPNSFQFAEGSPVTGQFSAAQNQSFKTSTWRSSALETSFNTFDSLHRYSASRNDGAIKQQRDRLILEQKRLEDHFSTLQGQLLTEFQQQQNKLLQMYEGSMQLPPEPDKATQSILERTQEESVAMETIALNTSDKENHILESKYGEFPKNPFRLGPRNASNDSQNSSPNVGVTVRSFNSETSLQEFYDITYFGENASGKETVIQRKERDEMEKQVEKEISSRLLPKNSGKSSRNFSCGLMSSPNLTQLNSFESQTKEIKDTWNYNFSVISAYAKGFLTRLLFQTEKVTALITTLKDAKNVLNEMKSETSQSMTDRSFMERVKTQLQSAQSELRKIFLDVSPRFRMEIIEQNRRLLKEKQARNENKVISKVNSQTKPRLSHATVKKRLSRKHIQEKPLKSGKTASPSSVIKTTVASDERAKLKNTVKNVETKESNAVAMTTRKTKGAVTRITNSGKAAEISKTAGNRSPSRVTKLSSKVTADTTKRRRTWDTGVLKPIQGRISPTLPHKGRSSADNKQPISSLATRKVEQKVTADHQAIRGTRGVSGTVGNSRINNKTYKVDRPYNAVRTGARRSLAANLSNK